MRIYGLDVDGITQLFARTSVASYQLTPTPAVVEVDLDFGSVPVDTAIFTVVDASVTPASKITIVQSGETPTGRTVGESELDPIAASARAGTGSFTVYCAALTGRVVGNYKFNYQVGK